MLYCVCVYTITPLRKWQGYIQQGGETWLQSQWEGRRGPFFILAMCMYSYIVCRPVTVGFGGCVCNNSFFAFPGRREKKVVLYVLVYKHGYQLSYSLQKMGLQTLHARPIKCIFFYCFILLTLINNLTCTRRKMKYSILGCSFVYYFLMNFKMSGWVALVGQTKSIDCVTCVQSCPCRQYTVYTVSHTQKFQQMRRS